MNQPTKQWIDPALTAAILQAWAECDYPPAVFPLVLRPGSDAPVIIANADELRRQTIGAVPVVTVLE